MKLTVGQTLWFVPERWHGKPEGRDVRITKVGRLWFEHDGSADRFDVKTLRHENGSGQCYLSADEHAAHIARAHEWKRIGDFVYRGRPPLTVSVEDMRQAAKLLGVPTEDS